MIEGLIQWSPGVTLEQVEEQVIRHAYKFYQRNKSATARALDISIRTLDSKLEKYENDDQARKQRDEQNRKRDIDWLARHRGVAASNAIAGAAATDLPNAAAGVYVESASQDSAEQPLPVSQPEKVQKVLPQPIAASGAGRRR